MIAFVASDLVWSSRIKATADAVGAASRRVYAPGDLETLLGDGPLELVLIDLESDDADAIIQALRGPEATEVAQATPAIAWGPHVMADRLAWASEAGIERVMPRGAFASKLEKLIREHMGD